MVEARKPTFKLTVDQKDITLLISQRLISITFVDNAKAEQADHLTLSVWHENGRVKRPPKGAILQLWLGYEETTLAYFGQFIVDDVEIDPYQLTINAQATPVNTNKAHSLLNTQRTRSLPQGLSIGSLCQLIANNHKLAVKVATPIANIALGVVYQRHESDLHLLTRLSKDFHFNYKIANSTLIAYPTNDASAGGTQALPTLTLTPSQTLDWHHKEGGRTEGGTVVATYRGANKQNLTIGAGVGEPTRRLKRVYPSQSQANRAANAQLTANQKDQANLRLELEGDPSLIAEGKLTLKGFIGGLNRTYTLQTVTHTLDSNGYQTTIEAY